MPIVRTQWVGGAPQLTLLSDITSGATSILASSSASAYPDGSLGPFVITLDTLGVEEKVLCTSRTGNTFTVNTRGYDGTAAATHLAGITINHTLSAIYLQDVSDHIYLTARDDHTQYYNQTRHDAHSHVGVPGIAAVVSGATVATSQSTSSISYADLATVGPTATVIVGASGLAEVTLTCQSFTGTANHLSYMGVALSGANTVAAADTVALSQLSGSSTFNGMYSATFLLSGLAAGSTTFTAKYKTDASTFSFLNRSIIVRAL